MDKIISKLSLYSVLVIVSLITFIVVLSSVPLVYFIMKLFGAEYVKSIFFISVATPLLMVPPTIILLLRITKSLKYFKDHLKVEVEKNRAKDMILLEQARFVLMGEMMANISHQWKQPLNTIGLAVVNARVSSLNEKELTNNFDVIEDNVNHLASTINDFMTFFDKKTYTELRGIEEIVKEIKSIVSAHIRNKNINLEILIDNSHGEIEIASSISQVVLNLINNAKDAFEEESKNRSIKVTFFSNEYGLEIECCDSGVGVKEEIKDKIFDPYFTTKARSQGTGIGLHMSKEIVQKIFNGRINISARKTSRSVLYPNDCSARTCFFIAVPYSDKCVLKEEF